METTRTSLLVRVKNREDSQAWCEFVGLYRPILLRYARARGLNHVDAEDVAQQCLATITEKMASFEYDPSRGRFRAWLRTMVNHRIQNVRARRREQIADSGDFKRPQEREPSPEEAWDQIWQEEHLKYCLEQIRTLVESKTFEAFSPRGDRADTCDGSLRGTRHDGQSGVRRAVAPYVSTARDDDGNADRG